MSNYVYKQTEGSKWGDSNNLYTVGYYWHDVWYPESDHNTPDEAAQRVHYLNGGNCNQDCNCNQENININAEVVNALDKCMRELEYLGYWWEHERKVLASAKRENS